MDSVNDYYDVRLKADRLAQTGIDLARAAYGELVRSDRYPALFELVLADEFESHLAFGG